MLGRQPRPDRVERLQPGKQLLVDRFRMGAGQRLVEMMMRVDEAGQHDMAARRRSSRRPARRRGAAGHELDDPAVLDDEAAVGALGENRERVFDPQPHATAPLDPARLRRRLPGRDANRAPASRRDEGGWERKQVLTFVRARHCSRMHAVIISREGGDSARQSDLSANCPALRYRRVRNRPKLRMDKRRIWRTCWRNASIEPANDDRPLPTR